MKITDTMPYGKYKGKTLGWISENDPSYILWLDTNTQLDIPKVLIRRAENELAGEDSDE